MTLSLLLWDYIWRQYTIIFYMLFANIFHYIKYLIFRKSIGVYNVWWFFSYSQKILFVLDLIWFVSGRNVFWKHQKEIYRYILIKKILKLRSIRIFVFLKIFHFRFIYFSCSLNFLIHHVLHQIKYISWSYRKCEFESLECSSGFDNVCQIITSFLSWFAWKDSDYI